MRQNEPKNKKLLKSKLLLPQDTIMRRRLLPLRARPQLALNLQALLLPKRKKSLD